MFAEDTTLLLLLALSITRIHVTGSCFSSMLNGIFLDIDSFSLRLISVLAVRIVVIEIILAVVLESSVEDALRCDYAKIIHFPL